jgi:hypothetical protein
MHNRLHAYVQDLADIRRRTSSEEEQTSSPSSFNTSVQYFPLHACSLDFASFVLPAASSAAVFARRIPHTAGLAPPDALPGKLLISEALQLAYLHALHLNQ